MSAPGPFSGYGRRTRGVPSPHFGSTPGSTRLLDDVSPPRKTDCPGHAAGVDELGRWPVGDCGPDCLMRRYRLGLATWTDGRWT